MQVMSAHRNGDIVVDLFILLFIIGVAFVWHIAKNIKTLKQQRIFALVFLAVISLALSKLWLFTSPDARGSEPRMAFEFWRIMVTFICIAGGVPAVIALIAGYKEK
jgi:hypothetical protein